MRNCFDKDWVQHVRFHFDFMQSSGFNLTGMILTKIIQNFINIIEVVIFLQFTWMSLTMVCKAKYIGPIVFYILWIWHYSIKLYARLIQLIKFCTLRHEIICIAPNALGYISNVEVNPEWYISCRIQPLLLSILDGLHSLPLEEDTKHHHNWRVQDKVGLPW